MKFRGNHRLYIVPSKVKIKNERFLLELFDLDLKSTEHPLLRFHTLYQVLEWLFDLVFDKQFQKTIGKFSNQEINKNNFIEEINELRKERINIRKLTNFIQTKSVDFDSENFGRTSSDFLNQYSSTNKSHLGDKIYNIRNLMVHSYWSIPTNDCFVDEILHQFELFIINIIEHFDIVEFCSSLET